MQFGKQETTTLLDDDGSKLTKKANIVSGMINKPVRNYYEMKTRVHDQKEEHAAYLTFSDDLRNDRSKLDPAWRIEHNPVGQEKGYYYVVACYTQLEY